MKKILFIAIAVLAGFAGTKYYVSNQETSENSLLLQNVEALSTGESGFFIPCIQSELQCTFNAVDASGKKCTITIDKAEKASPFL